MPDNDDDIPVLTDTIDHLPALTDAGDLDELEALLCARSLQLAEDLLTDASREAEHILKNRVMNELRAELPALVRRILREHFDQ